MFKHFIISLFCLAFIASNSFGQNTETTLIAPAALQADYQQLYDVLIEYHPNPYEYISKEALEDFKNEGLATLTEGMSERAFHVEVRKLVAAIKCGHTFAKPSNQWYKTIRNEASMLPIDMRFVDGKPVVSSIFFETKELHIGYEILSINGVEIATILNEMREIQERDGITNAFVEYRIQKMFRTMYLFLYDTRPTHDIEFVKADGSRGQINVASVFPKKTIVRTQEAKVNPLLKDMEVVVKNDWAKLYVDSLDQTAYLKIKKFGRKGYKSFYKEAFESIESNQSNQLIIDLRNNGGGYFPNGNRLLKYLADEAFYFEFSVLKKKRRKYDNLEMATWARWTKVAFNMMPKKNRVEGRKTYRLNYKPYKDKFKGKVTVITNGGSFSLSTYIAAFLKHKRANVAIYGSETGGTEIGSHAILNNVLVLPNSKVNIIIPFYFLSHGLDIENTGKGVMPNATTLMNADNVSVKDELLEILQNNDTISK